MDASKRRDTVRSLLTLVVFLSALAGASGVPFVSPSTLLIARDGVDLHMGSFYPAGVNNAVATLDGDSGDGAAQIMRGTTPLAPVRVTDHVRLYDFEQGDLFCVAENCRPQQGSGRLAVVDDVVSWWSTRIVWLSIGSNEPNLKNFSMDSPSATRIALVSYDTTKALVFALDAGKNAIDAGEMTVFHGPWLPYAFLFAAICAAMFHVLVANQFGIRKALQRTRWFSALLIGQLTLFYLAVYPGMFSTDMVLSDVSHGRFSVWYSSLYMVYAVTLSPLYPWLIQLPNVLAYAAAAIYLAYRLDEARAGRAYIGVFFAVQLLSPAVFAMLFSQQRIFVAGVVMFAALILNFTDLVRSRRLSPLGLGLLIASILLRPEYVLVFAAFLMLIVSSGTPDWLRQARRAIELLVLAFLAVNAALPAVSGTSIWSANAKYSLPTTLDLAKPYVDCTGRQGDIAAIIGRLGPIDSYCETTAERFFWDKAAASPDDVLLSAASDLKSAVLGAMLRDPLPSLVRLSTRMGELATQPIWQIYDRYADPDMTANLPGATVHLQQASVNNLAQGFAWQKPLLAALTRTYQAIGYVMPTALALLFTVLVVPLLSRDMRIQVINLAVIGIVLFSAFASPAVNWSYLIIVHVWAVLVVPLARLGQRYPKVVRAVADLPRSASAQPDS